MRSRTTDGFDEQSDDENDGDVYRSWISQLARLIPFSAICIRNPLADDDGNGTEDNDDTSIVINSVNSSSDQTEDNDEASIVIESVNSSSSDTEESSVTERGESRQSDVQPSCQRIPDCWKPIASRGAIEFAWHAAGRVVNAATYVGLASAPASMLRPIAIVPTIASAAYYGYRLTYRALDWQGDTETSSSTLPAASKTLVASLGAAAAGVGAGVAMYYGSAVPAIAIGAGNVISFIISERGAHAHFCRQPQSRCTPRSTSLLPPAILMTSCATGIGIAIGVPTLRALDRVKLDRRTIAVLAECATVEILKGTSARSIPGVDRELLGFENRLTIGLIGMLPYALASGILNGWVGSLLQAEMDSDRFETYVIPMLVGALANVVKGSVNTALMTCTSLRDHQSPVAVLDPKCPACPSVRATIEKSALRFLIANARDLLFIALVDRGVPKGIAGGIAYSLYALFAEHRDLMLDAMRGDGWTEPTMHARTSRRESTGVAAAQKTEDADNESIIV